MKNFGTSHHGWPLGLLDRLDPCLVVFSNYLPILCCQVTILKLGKLTQDPANIPLKSSYGQKTILGNGNMIIHLGTVLPTPLKDLKHHFMRTICTETKLLDCWSKSVNKYECYIPKLQICRISSKIPNCNLSLYD